ncbi:MAG: GNAT family N-acetyltransferase [Clostridiales bacterium]|nr:GNAT family N-acetyltransferase [Clostridiales bacterium]
MLDKSVKHYGVMMVQNKRIYPMYMLPKGYTFDYYQLGDEEDWTTIETAVGEFESHSEGKAHFLRTFGRDTKETMRRCLFVCDEHQNKIATASAWFGQFEGETHPRIHWVAVHPEHCGKGICKALISEILKRYTELGEYEPVYLTTQTWSYTAINIYKKFNFVPYNDDRKGIIKGRAGDFEMDFDAAWEIIDDKIETYKKS